MAKVGDDHVEVAVEYTDTQSGSYSQQLSKVVKIELEALKTGIKYETVIYFGSLTQAGGTFMLTCDN